jgi:hypothetical protein
VLLCCLSRGFPLVVLFVYCVLIVLLLQPRQNAENVDLGWKSNRGGSGEAQRDPAGGL